MSKQTTREHLIQVGLEMLRTVGYLDAGVNQLLAAAKVPKGSFYHHFATKDEFVLEIIRRYAGREQDRWERLLDKPTGSPRRRLRRYFRELIGTYGMSGGPIGGCLLGNMSVQATGQNRAIKMLLLQAFNSWQEAIAGTIREAVARCELPPDVRPDDIAALLVNGWEGAQVRAKVLQSDLPLRLFFTNAFEVLLKQPPDLSCEKQLADNT